MSEDIGGPFWNLFLRTEGKTWLFALLWSPLYMPWINESWVKRANAGLIINVSFHGGKIILISVSLPVLDLTPYSVALTVVSTICVKNTRSPLLKVTISAPLPPDPNIARNISVDCNIDQLTDGWNLVSRRSPSCPETHFLIAAARSSWVSWYALLTGLDLPFARAFSREL